jgi:hypothetical protein
MTKSRGRPFEAGNTAGRGRPKGSKNKATLLRQELLSEHQDAVIRKCLRMALEGDPTAMRLCMERMLPLRRAMPVEFKVPRIEKVSDLPSAVNSVLRAVAKGKLTPAEGEQILPLLEAVRKILTVQELEARVKSVEETVAIQQKQGPAKERSFGESPGPGFGSSG